MNHHVQQYASATLITFFCFALSSCSSGPNQPRINFIGLSKGTLQSEADSLSFQNRFETTDRELIGIVAFDNIEEGSEVTASWFSPDDRTPPFGQNKVVTQSGAKIVRFSLANTEDWTPGPYMLQIRANTVEDDIVASASGSLQFAIGLTDDEIQAYVQDYAEWERRQQEQRAAVAAEEEREKTLLDEARTTLDAPDALLALRLNLLGDDVPEYILIDTKNLPAFEPSINPAVALSHPVNQFAIIGLDGSMPLSLRARDGERVLESNGAPLGDALPLQSPQTLTVLPSGTITLTWQDDGLLCTAELRPTQDGYREESRLCR